MQVSIHGANRYQERTELSLHQLREIFKKDAVVVLNERYQLFYDHIAKRHLIAVVGRNGHLVTILYVHSKLSSTIPKPTDRQRKLAKQKALSLFPNAEREFWVWARVERKWSGNRSALYSSQIDVIPASRCASLDKTAGLRAYLQPLVQTAQRYFASVKKREVVADTYRVTLAIYTEDGRLVQRCQYDVKNILALLPEAERTVTVSLACERPDSEKVEYELGTVVYQPDLGRRQLIKRFRSDLQRVVEAVETMGTKTDKKRLKYHFVLHSSTLSCVVQKFGRVHPALKADLKALDRLS